MPIRIRDVQQAQPVNPIQAAADPISSPRRRAGLQTLNRLYRRFGTTLALCGAGVLGVLIWYYSSIYTLDYLADTFVHVAQFARSEPQWKAFLIRATVSAIEIFSGRSANGDSRCLCYGSWSGCSFCSVTSLQPGVAYYRSSKVRSCPSNSMSTNAKSSTVG